MCALLTVLSADKREWSHYTLIRSIATYCCLGWCFISKLLVSIILCLFFFLSMLEPAVSVANGSELVSAQLWIEINAMDKAIKALFVPFVTTGWGLKQSVFYQCQRCDETWLTQEANGIKAPICQACSRPDRSKRKRPELYRNPKLPLYICFFNNPVDLELQGLVKKGESMFFHSNK